MNNKRYDIETVVLNRIKGHINNQANNNIWKQVWGCVLDPLRNVVWRPFKYFIIRRINEENK